MKSVTGSFVKRLLLPLSDRLLGQRMMQRLALLERVQWWPAERIREQRDRDLQTLIATVYAEVPVYRELMDEARVGPSDIKTPSDLSRLPIVTKDTLRNGYPERTTRPTGQKTYEACSSGSTGRPFCVLEDARTAGSYRAPFLLALEWAGWRFGERHMQMGMTLKRSQGRWVKDQLLRTYYVSAYDLREEQLVAHLDQIERRDIKHVWGYPGAIYYLARAAEKRGWNMPLSSVVTWGDSLFDVYRSTIESVFRARIHDTYGCAEGMQISAQCGAGDRYHVHDLDVVVEYVDDAGDPVEGGTEGNVVVTRLHAGPSPFVRYRLGDVATGGGVEGCPCGRGFSLMLGIRGRETDVVVTPSGNRLIVHFFTAILEYFPEIDSFQVVQTDANRLVIRIVPAVGFTAETASRVVAMLSQHGADIAMEIDVVDEIPLTAGGKRRFVINEVGPQASVAELGRKEV